MNELDTRIINLETRLERVESWRTHIDIQRAKEEVDRKYIDEKFEALNSSIKEFKGYLIWLILAIGAAVVSNLTTFIMNGGLAQ